MIIASNCAYCSAQITTELGWNPVKILCGVCGCALSIERKAAGEVEVTLLEDNP